MGHEIIIRDKEGAPLRAPSLSPAQQLRADIETEVVLVVANEFKVSRGYAKLARLLSLFKLNESWRELGHSSFNSYLLTLKEKYNRSSQQLYAYVAVAEKLLPLVGEEALDKMGVTKATAIVKAASKAKKNIPQELIDLALDEKIDVEQIRAFAFKLFELNGEQPKGKYQDFGGAYLDEEEQKTFREAVLVTKCFLNIPSEAPDWLQRKRIIMAWAQEFLGSYSADVYGVPDAAKT